MKIEIDLNDILHSDDYGSETFQESIRRQVVDKIKQEVTRGVSSKIDHEVCKIINEEVLLQVRQIAPKLLNDLIDLEYQPITSYGNKDGDKTTLRKKFIEVLTKEFVFSKKNHLSDNNAFTNAILTTVQDMTQQFKKDFDKEVNSTFTKECLDYAVIKLKTTLGIK